MLPKVQTQGVKSVPESYNLTNDSAEHPQVILANFVATVLGKISVLVVKINLDLLAMLAAWLI